MSVVEEQDSVLVPSVTRPVDFYGEELLIALVEAKPYVALRTFCEYLGLAWSSQLQRARRDPVLARHLQSLRMAGADGKQREIICLELEYLPGWLFGITTSKARPDLEPKVTRYREECFQILWRAFQAELREASPLAIVPSASHDPSTVALMQIRETALAIAQLAEQQLALQGQVTAAHQRLDRAAVVVSDLQRRMSAVEQRLSPDGAITDEQAAAIANQVKALAVLLTEQDASKNHYQGIFSELYRRFGVSSYKLVRRGQYHDVLAFLEEWRHTATPPQV